MPNIQQNTTTLQAILEMVNTLPGVGGGSGTGGLPDGVSALASGTFTPTSDITLQDISHGLGVTPNFYIVAVETDVSREAVASMMISSMKLHKEIYDKSTTYPIQYVTGIIKYFNSEGTGNAYSVYGLISQTIFTASRFRISLGSACVLKAGHTYRWVCGVIGGIN